MTIFTETQTDAVVVPPRRKSHRVLAIVGAIVVALGAVLWGIGWWILEYFGPISIDQALINVQGVDEGAGGHAVRSFILLALIIPLLLAAAGLTLFALIRRRNTNRAIAIAATLAIAAVPVVGVGTFAHAAQLTDYATSALSTADVGNFYREPTVVSGPAVQKKPNLVLIYLESVETDMGDAALFGTDMLAPLDDATEGWQSLTLHQAPAGGWTLSGIVGTQCGIRLRLIGANDDSHGANNAGEEVEEYLPGATCLGDVLKASGYSNVFVGGAMPSFAGKATYLADHGYDTIYGLDEWQRRGETEVRDWGLSDRRLFANAKRTLSQLHSAGKPFNLTVLTLDTHSPDHVFPYCEQAQRMPRRH